MALFCPAPYQFTPLCGKCEKIAKIAKRKKNGAYTGIRSITLDLLNPYPFVLGAFHRPLVAKDVLFETHAGEIQSGCPGP